MQYEDDIMSKRDMIINPITGEIDLDLHKIVKGFSTGGQSLKDNLKIDAPQRTPSHPSSSHVVKTRVDGKDKMIRFGEQGAKTNQNPKQRKAFKDRHAKNCWRCCIRHCLWVSWPYCCVSGISG